MSVRILTASLLALTVGHVAAADEPADWTSWRGPNGHGNVASENYPDRFGAKDYLWRAELPGKGCSTPIVLNGHIYVTSPVDGRDALLGIDSAGKEVWRAVFGPQAAGKHRNGSGCNASPITDGDGIFVYFKSGTLAAVDLDGSVRWKTNIVERFGKDTLFWDHGTSPVLTEKFVVLARMHKGESWLAAFDKRSGDLAWKVARNYETPVECDHGYTTPLVITHNGQESVLLWGAEHITIHNASDGNVSWSCGNFNPEANRLWPAIATPVIVNDMAVIAYGRNDRGIPRLHGVKLSGRGDVTDSNHVWLRDDIGTFVPTPAVHNGRVVMVRDRGQVVCFDPTSGKTVWENAFPKGRANYYSSPLVAGDKLIAPREDGVVFVASLADDTFRVLAENNMGEPVIGSPVPLGNRLLIRGIHNLFCVAGESPASEAEADCTDGSLETRAASSVSVAETKQEKAAATKKPDRGPTGVGSVLVFAGTGWYRHPETAAISGWLARLADETGMQIDVTENPRDLNLLPRYDVLVLNNANELTKLFDLKQRNRIRDWYRAGGGIVALHAALVHQTEWEWFTKIAGCDFNSDSEFLEARVVVDPKSKNHPTVRGLASSFPYKADWTNHTRSVTGLPGFRVLLRVDESTFEPVRAYFKTRGGKPMGKDHPVAWLHENDGGRFFYTELGHDVRSLNTPFGKQHVVEAIKWAAGK